MTYNVQNQQLGETGHPSVRVTQHFLLIEKPQCWCKTDTWRPTAQKTGPRDGDTHVWTEGQSQPHGEGTASPKNATGAAGHPRAEQTATRKHEGKSWGSWVRQ